MNIFDKLRASSPQPTGPVEYIIAGLGNPGSQYEDTRHNAGFMALDTLAEQNNVSINKVRFKSLCGDIMINGKRCLLLKPSTYMNKSGEAVVEAMNFYKLPTEKLLVIFDDVSLDVSKMRIRQKGSDGGHNGIKNIIYLTGKDSFPRIKIGVGKKPSPEYDLADWVLSRFKADEIPALREVCGKACEAVELIINGKVNDAMNKYN